MTKYNENDLFIWINRRFQNQSYIKILKQRPDVFYKKGEPKN